MRLQRPVAYNASEPCVTNYL